MIEIVPFNKNLFDTFTLDKQELTKYCYINNIDLISQLLSSELPITNTRIALKNIFNFLAYVDNRLSTSDTLLVIKQDILIEYFSRNKYKEYMKLLHNLCVISAVSYQDGKFYKPGKLYTQYRVHNKYINEEDLAIVVLDSDDKSDKFNNEVINLDERFVKTIKTIEINIKSAIYDEIKYYEENNLTVASLRNRISRIFYTRRKRFIKTGKKVNRIYHSFSNVSKVSRRHLNIKFFNVDIKNCQPLLLCYLLKSKCLSLDENYQIACEKGLFYEDFINEELDRDMVKVALYKNVFFGFNKINKINKKFKELYPKTWASLDIISNSNISLASQLQNIESDLFNNLIPKKSKFYFTLFDAIYFDNIDDLKIITKNINKFFENLKIKVKIEINL